MIGSKLGSYKIVEALGEGGMGVVYVGEHTVLGRRAAIKVLHPDLARRPDTVKRFLHEARSATRVKHPGLVDVFDFGTDEAGNAYLIMELLDGESLSSRLKRSGIPDHAWAVQVTRQIALAVDAVHAQGIVHRDLKPDNVFLCRDEAVPGGERVKVLDFGLAKAAADDRGASLRTRTGTVMGTPLYMSPEQCRGAGTPLDVRSDVYSLGCILYELLAGRPPFVHEGLGDLLVSHIHDAPVPPSTLQAGVPADLEAVCLGMLGKKPDERPQTLRKVIELLEATAAGKSTLSGSYARAAIVSSPPPAALAASARGSAGSTTLAGAASQMVTDQRPPRRAPIVLGLGAMLVVAATIGYVIVRDDAPPARPTETAAAPAPAPEPAAPAPEPAPAPASPPAAPALVKLRIETTPPGAMVLRATDSVAEPCTTPCTLERPRGGTGVWLLRLARHKDRQISIALDQDGTHTFTLERLKAAAPGPTPRVEPRKPIKNAVVNPYD